MWRETQAVIVWHAANRADLPDVSTALRDCFDCGAMKQVTFFADHAAGAMIGTK